MMRRMGNTSADPASSKAKAGQSSQYLTFMLGGEEYGVNILNVQEIKSGAAITRIPKLPSYIKGVLNLRGVIVPVVDFRERFSVEAGNSREVTTVIILNVETAGQASTVGAIVDNVSDVYDLSDDQIKPTPDFGAAISTEFIEGIAILEGRTVIVLNSNKLFSLEELSKMDELDSKTTGR